MNPLPGRAQTAWRAYSARRFAREGFAALQADTDPAIRQLVRDGCRADPAEFRKADEYAADVLGSPVYAPWLKVYTTAAGGFREGWIPDNYYGAEVVPRINGRYRTVTDAKTFLNRIVRSPHVPDLAYVLHGRFYDRDYRPVPSERFARVLFDAATKVAFKPESGGRGKHFDVIERGTLDVEKFRNSGNGVFQRYIVQHPFFDAMTTGSATTIRITTAIDRSGAAGVRAAYVRVARRADRCVQSASAVRVNADLATGRLAGAAYLPDWSRVDRHPDSGFRFGGQEIPSFRAAIDLVVGMHASFPQATCIGWDVCIDADGVPQIFEWNTNHNGIKFSEATTGPCFADLGWETLWKQPMQRKH